MLRAVYGDVRGERWTDGRFVLKSGVIFSAISTGQEEPTGLGNVQSFRNVTPIIGNLLSKRTPNGGAGALCFVAVDTGSVVTPDPPTKLACEE